MTDREAHTGQLAAAGVAPAHGESTEFTDVWRPSESGVPRGPERVLVQQGVITMAQLEQALQQQREGKRITALEALIQSHTITDLQALEAVAAYAKLPLVRVAAADLQEDIVRLLPTEYLKEKKIIPIRREGEAVVVGLADPTDIFLIDDLKRRLRRRLQLVVTPPGDTLRALDELLNAPAEKVDEIIKDIAEDSVEVMDNKIEEVTDLEKIAGESPVIRYVNFLIAAAVRDGASDIHIEPQDARLRVRLRIDGVLFEQTSPPYSMHAAIVSRLKIMANLDISERRLPQDGRIRVIVHGRQIDLRVSTLPISHGEKCVIRILDNRATMVGLQKLGMAPDTLEAFQNEIVQPHGIILVTGPTGSGKSTTLYSALRIMDGDTMNISTVEDPVEYELDFANQVSVHESIGMTFSAALRSLLRQDPDVIMVGEIRDAETARIAVQASLTGHLVLSTLHTNDAPGSITRLINIGIEPYLISASVNAVLAQRLVRRTCEHCKTPVTEVKDSLAVYLKKYGFENIKMFAGRGCDKCRNTGFKGRLGIYEFLRLDDSLRDKISSNPSLTELRRLARESGMRTLRDDGMLKVASGQTTIDEIMRATET